MVEIARRRRAATALPRAARIRLAARQVGRLRRARGREPLLNSTQVRYAYTDKFRFASTKAARELGYTFSPLEPAIRDALAWFRAHGMLA